MTVGRSGKEVQHRILRESDFGRCVFFSDNDVNDTQTIEMVYPDGLRAVIRMDCIRREGERKAHFVFVNGEIDAGGSTITLRRKDSAPETYDFSGIIGSPLHAGADKKMVHEFLDSVTSGKTTRTDLSSALKSHLICIS